MVDQAFRCLKVFQYLDQSSDAFLLLPDSAPVKRQRRRCVALPGADSADLSSLVSFFYLVLAAEAIITPPSVVCLLHVSGSEYCKAA
ncbi:hypothetical protein T4B_3493 [Trichinella pseudospiralis]|uniref:Uncharacterized protein n=1 Tax=Trichinella pseudospiralis TaxID=6337 RepID=A0A0V1K2N7_TRIPS|nr:hypothetical protein T4A_2067 [Trichinella pseudospiralis]KRZ09138.1 hypothetical protein T4B_3493 [Trichinella pseudospiralis]KRZ41484.1 hypothetical protein T4C_10289 [Trichinella pseudospiralis]